jgi:hypothetical protein
VVPSLTVTPTGGPDKLVRLACLFPTEWSDDDATIEARYGWVKTLPLVSGAPQENYDKFAAYIKAQGFWTAAAIPDLPARHWHLNPRALISLLRGPQLWPVLANRWQAALSGHVLPDETGLTGWAKTCLYEYATRSSKAAARDHASAANTEALRTLDAGAAMILGMRVETDIDANRGKGLWDDRVVVLKKGSTGLTKIIFNGPFTTEPTGRYLTGGEFYASPNGSDVNVGGTSDFDSGRLVSERSYEYFPANSSSKGQSIPGTIYNILKKTVPSSIERLVTNTPSLPAGVYVSGTNTHWITGTAANFSERQTMHFHEGYGGNTGTGSAGCQTFPIVAGQTFHSFGVSLKPLQGASRFQYVLIGM